MVLENSAGTKPKTDKWDRRFWSACREIATWSSCLSRQIGAIIVRDRTVVSTGYNGPPRGIPHCGRERALRDETLKAFTFDPQDIDACPRQAMGYGSGEGLRYCIAGHAEENAIVNAARLGVSTLNTIMYMSCGVPCKNCMIKIINAGIIEIVCESTALYDEESKFLLDHSYVNFRQYTFMREEE